MCELTRFKPVIITIVMITLITVTCLSLATVASTYYYSRPEAQWGIHPNEVRATNIKAGL